MVVVCGECSDTKWFIQPGYGAWLISCSNGHKLIPTGGTEYVIDQSQLSEVSVADPGRASYGDHPSGGQADRDTSVLSETEARQRADGGSDRGERGEDGGTVTTTTEIWDKMQQLYQEALRARDSYAARLAATQDEEEKRRKELFEARQEIDRQRKRANRSQNEAGARVSQLRDLNHRYEAMRARAERLEAEVAQRADRTVRYTEAWDKLMEIAPQFKDALEELLLDE